MEKFVVFYSAVGLGVLVLSLFIGPHYRALGVANLRNIFIVGFCYFQFYGVIKPIWINDYGTYDVIDPAASAMRFAAYSFLFLSMFFATYNWIFKRQPQPTKPQMRFGADPEGVPLLITAIVLAVVAFATRFSGFIPVVGPLLNHVLNGSAAAATCLAVYVMARNITNPILVLPACGVIGLSMFNSILADFGRRGLVGILASGLWGLYFARPQAFTTKAFWLKAAPLMLVAMMIVGSFSGVRHESDLSGQGGARVQGIIDGLSLDAAFSLFNLPDTGIATLWIIDSRMDTFEYEHLFSIEYFFLHMVPRKYLPDKPEPLSRRIPIQADKKGVALGVHTVGPGIIGHAASDGGYYAAIVYGVIFGLILGKFDQILLRNRYAPFAVAGIGCTLGQLLGLSRGESSVFMGIILMGVVGNLFLLLILDCFFRQSYPVQLPHAYPPSHQQGYPVTARSYGPT